MDTSAQQSDNSREGYRPANYQRDYRAGGRPQRPRIHTQRAYTTDKSRTQDEGGFRLRASELLCKVLEDSNSSAHISHVPTSSVRVVMGSSMAISATKAISHVREQTAISPGITITENRMEVISRVRAASSHVRAAMDSHVRVAMDSHVRAAMDSSVRVATSSVAATSSAHRATILTPSTA